MVLVIAREPLTDFANALIGNTDLSADNRQLVLDFTYENLHRASSVPTSIDRLSVAKQMDSLLEKLEVNGVSKRYLNRLAHIWSELQAEVDGKIVHNVWCCMWLLFQLSQNPSDYLIMNAPELKLTKSTSDSLLFEELRTEFVQEYHEINTEAFSDTSNEDVLLEESSSVKKSVDRMPVEWIRLPSKDAIVDLVSDFERRLYWNHTTNEPKRVDDPAEFDRLDPCSYFQALDESLTGIQRNVYASNLIPLLERDIIREVIMFLDSILTGSDGMKHGTSFGIFQKMDGSWDVDDRVILLHTSHSSLRQLLRHNVTGLANQVNHLKRVFQTKPPSTFEHGLSETIWLAICKVFHEKRRILYRWFNEDAGLDRGMMALFQMESYRNLVSTVEFLGSCESIWDWVQIIEKDAKTLTELRTVRDAVYSFTLRSIEQGLKREHFSPTLHQLVNVFDETLSPLLKDVFDTVEFCHANCIKIPSLQLECSLLLRDQLQAFGKEVNRLVWVHLIENEGLLFKFQSMKSIWFMWDASTWLDRFDQHLGDINEEPRLKWALIDVLQDAFLLVKRVDPSFVNQSMEDLIQFCEKLEPYITRSLGSPLDILVSDSARRQVSRVFITLFQLKLSRYLLTKRHATSPYRLKMIICLGSLESYFMTSVVAHQLKRIEESILNDGLGLSAMRKELDVLMKHLSIPLFCSSNATSLRRALMDLFSATLNLDVIRFENAFRLLRGSLRIMSQQSNGPLSYEGAEIMDMLQF